MPDGLQGEPSGTCCCVLPMAVQGLVSGGEGPASGNPGRARASQACTGPVHTDQAGPVGYSWLLFGLISVHDVVPVAKYFEHHPFLLSETVCNVLKACNTSSHRSVDLVALATPCLSWDLLNIRPRSQSFLHRVGLDASVSQQSTLFYLRLQCVCRNGVQ